MKKIEYMAPEMEEVKLNVLTSLLSASVNDDEPGNGGNGDQFEE